MQQLGENIFSDIDYTTMVDDHRTTIRALGLDATLSPSERRWGLLVIAALLALVAAAAAAALRDEEEEKRSVSEQQQ